MPDPPLRPRSLPASILECLRGLNFVPTILARVLKWWLLWTGWHGELSVVTMPAGVQRPGGFRALVVADGPSGKLLTQSPAAPTRLERVRKGLSVIDTNSPQNKPRKSSETARETRRGPSPLTSSGRLVVTWLSQAVFYVQGVFVTGSSSLAHERCPFRSCWRVSRLPAQRR